MVPFNIRGSLCGLVDERGHSYKQIHLGTNKIFKGKGRSRRAMENLSERESEAKPILTLPYKLI